MPSITAIGLRSATFNRGVKAPKSVLRPRFGESGIDMRNYEQFKPKAVEILANAMLRFRNASRAKDDEEMAFALEYVEGIDSILMALLTPDEGREIRERARAIEREMEKDEKNLFRPIKF